MEIKELEIRMYYLAGQLEEAKKIYRDAIAELEKQQKVAEVKIEEPVAS